MRLIGRVAKARRYNVQPKMLATLLSLKIKEVDRSHHENKEERRAKKALMSRRELKVCDTWTRGSPPSMDGHLLKC